MNNYLPLVSIIIPTFNSGKTLEKCLRSIMGQTYKKFEIIIVDGGSKDETIDIANKYHCKTFSLNGKERSFSINYGINVSTGEYIYRVDSDVILYHNLLEEAVHKCEIEGFNVVSIFWSPDPSISFWAKVRKLEKDCYKDDLARSGARFFRRSVIENIGGFNEQLIAGEDYDLYNRLKKREELIGLINAEELHIGEPRLMADIIRKQYYYGSTLLPFFKENRISGVIQMSPIRNSIFKNWRKFLHHPILTVGFIGYEFIVYFSTTVGFVVGTLWSLKNIWHEVQ
jgi:glycosyltransferase involved in cell wall biosynthesis